jgi:hypothetical protein
MSGPRTTRRQTLGYAGLADAAALVATGAAEAVTAHPDAELIATCREFEAMEAEYRRLSVAEDRAAGAEKKRLRSMMDALRPRYDEALETIAATRAVTEAGIRAKASAVATFWRPDSDQETGFELDYPIDRALWSLVEDAAGRA